MFVYIDEFTDDEWRRNMAKCINYYKKYFHSVGYRKYLSSAGNMFFISILQIINSS